MTYTLVLELVAFFLLDIGGVEGFFLQHDEFPLHGIEHVELDLIDLVLGFGVDEEVLMVEKGVHQQVGTVLYIEYFPSRRLDEHILRHVPLALPQQHPAMQSLPQVQIGSQLVGLVIVDGESFLGQFLLHLLLVFHYRFVEGGMGYSFGENVLIDIELFLDVLVLVRLPQVGQKITVHQSPVLGGYFLGSNAEDAVGVVAHPNQQGAEEDTHVEAVSLLPPGHIGGTGDTFGELVRRI